jgi:hypothetical protein
MHLLAKHQAACCACIAQGLRTAAPSSTQATQYTGRLHVHPPRPLLPPAWLQVAVLHIHTPSGVDLPGEYRYTSTTALSTCQHRAWPVRHITTRAHGPLGSWYTEHIHDSAAQRSRVPHGIGGWPLQHPPCQPFALNIQTRSRKTTQLKGPWAVQHRHSSGGDHTGCPPLLAGCHPCIRPGALSTRQAAGGHPTISYTRQSTRAYAHRQLPKRKGAGSHVAQQTHPLPHTSVREHSAKSMLCLHDPYPPCTHNNPTPVATAPTKHPCIRGSRHQLALRACR